MRFSKTLKAAAVAAVALVSGFATTSQSVAADKFPSGPVELIVPFPAGGGTDRSARIFAEYLAKALGVPVNVINIGGGGGWVAWAQMAKWDPVKDDHKIGFLNLPHVFAYLDPKMGRTETVEDFNFIGGQTFDPCLWVVRTGDKRFSNMAEYVKYVTEHPGEIVMSTTAIGSDDYQGIAYAEKKINKFQVGKVYANNDAKKIQELLGNHTDAIAGNISYYVNYVMDGKMQPLAVLSEQRSKFMPSVPTFKEITGVNNICFAGRTLVAAPGLAPEKMAVYQEALKKTKANPEYRIQELEGASEIWDVTPEQLKKFLKDTEESVKVVEYWKQQ